MFAVVSLFTSHSPLTTVVNAADPGIEFGAADDLSVMGAEGNAADPDVEIKGFTVFGATQAAYTGAAAGPGNVVVNGQLSVSSGSYFTGSSTFPLITDIFISDGIPGYYVRKNSGGYLEWADPSTIGDNLGNHTATTTLNMGGQSIVNAASGTFTQGITASSFTAANTAGAGLFVSSSAYLAVSGGDVGIGTASPGARLEVAGQVKITGGSPGAGKVLSSDASGLATWAIAASTHAIGDNYGGGIIFWLDASGKHGLIAATADQSSAIQWWSGSLLTGGDF